MSTPFHVPTCWPLSRTTIFSVKLFMVRLFIKQLVIVQPNASNAANAANNPYCATL